MAGARKTWHAHVCRQCGLRYIDGCDTAGEDDRCTGCRGGRPWQLLIDNAAARECCLAARLVTKDERATYRLAGRANWHICPRCKRTFGHKPRPEEVHHVPDRRHRELRPGDPAGA